MDTAIGGMRVTIADADLLRSAWLVAVTVTICCAEMLARAVYKPFALIVPALAGEMLQITAMLFVFATVAANCWV